MKPRVFLCLDGQNVTGPYGLDELRLSVSRHEVAKTTMACEEGSEAWLPLGDLRPDAFRRAEKQASPKQKALMSYLGHPSAETATASEAAAWLDSACENESNQERLDSWKTDKLQLHPQLYAAELTAAKEQRAEDICQYCNDEKESYDCLDTKHWPLRKLTIKQCQQAVDWLDLNHPGWDAQLRNSEYGQMNDDIIYKHFFEGISAAAPQAVRNSDSLAYFTRKTTAAASLGNSQRKKRGCAWLISRLFIVFFALVALSTCKEIYDSAQRATAKGTNENPPPTPVPKQL